MAWRDLQEGRPHKSPTPGVTARAHSWNNPFPSVAALRYVYHLAPKGLSCADLADPNINAGPFSGSGRPPADAFFYSMVYWSLEGRPDRMDLDHNGIPCEALYDAEEIEAILEGGPVPLYIRY